MRKNCHSTYWIYFDDKSRLAQFRLQQILRPNEPASISANGSVEEILKITPASLFEAYESMLANDKIDIYVAGDINEEEIVAKLKKRYHLTIVHLRKFQQYSHNNILTMTM